MKNDALYYSVGALLYCPANTPDIAKAISQEKFGRKFSLALCLEDTIQDSFRERAEQSLIHSLRELRAAAEQKSFYIPKIFIRVKSPDQIGRLTQALKPELNLLTGFIFPKFSLNNCREFMQELILSNEATGKRLYMMPTYESDFLLDLRTRIDILYQMKDMLASIEELVLNIRVGGNDLCHLFGFRRHVDQTIYQMAPIASIFSDIITIYGRDYIISGPVWEYYAGPGWQTGLQREIATDMLYGFTGKTAIHPKQIAVINDAYKVTQADYKDALAILDWQTENDNLVAGSHEGTRMNEYNTHLNWARRTKYLAEYFGVKS